MSVLTPVFVESYIGKQTEAAIEPEFEGVSPDAKLASYLKSVGEPLVVANGRRPDYAHTFKALNSAKIPNAFAIGNGNVYITQGLLDKLDSEAELAYILGHEVGHVDRRHIAHQIDITLGGYAILGIGQLLAYGATKDTAVSKSDIRQARNVMLVLTVSGYSREFENQADHDGVAAMAAAGYDPWAAVSVMQKFQAMEAGAPRGIEAYFRSHPYSEDRVKSMSDQIRTNYGVTGPGQMGEQKAEPYLLVTRPERAALAREEAWGTTLAVGAGTLGIASVAAAAAAYFIWYRHAA